MGLLWRGSAAAPVSWRTQNSSLFTPAIERTFLRASDPHLHKPGITSLKTILDSPFSPAAFRFCLYPWLSSLWPGYALVWVSEFIYFQTHQVSGIKRLIWCVGGVVVVFRNIFSHCFFKGPVFFPCLGNLNACVLITLIAPHSALKPFLFLHCPHPPAAWRSWLCH